MNVDLLMPTWDPLRRRGALTGPPHVRGGEKWSRKGATVVGTMT